MYGTAVLVTRTNPFVKKNGKINACIVNTRYDTYDTIQHHYAHVRAKSAPRQVLRLGPQDNWVATSLPPSTEEALRTPILDRARGCAWWRMMAHGVGGQAVVAKQRSGKLSIIHSHDEFSLRHPSFERRVRDFQAAGGRPSVECGTRRQNKAQIPSSVNVMFRLRWVDAIDDNFSPHRDKTDGDIQSHKSNNFDSSHTRKVPRAQARSPTHPRADSQFSSRFAFAA